MSSGSTGTYFSMLSIFYCYLHGLLGGPAVFDRCFEEGGKFVCRGKVCAAGALAALGEEARPFVERVD